MMVRIGKEPDFVIGGRHPAEASVNANAVKTSRTLLESTGEGTLYSVTPGNSCDMKLYPFARPQHEAGHRNVDCARRRHRGLAITMAIQSGIETQ